MNFLASLFSCGRPQSARPQNCLSATPKNKIIPSDRCKIKEVSTNSKKLSISSPPSQMNDVIGIRMPQPHFMVFRGCFNRKEKDVDWGFLVGTVGCLPRHQNLIPRSCMRIGIGRGHQIQNLQSLRKNCLDKLVVYWGESEEEFPLKKLIRSRQPLILIVEEWPMLLQLMKIWEQQLLKALGESCLKESAGSILFNIINLEKQFLLEFQDALLFKDHAKQFLQKTLSFSLSPETIELLLQKMTLTDYAQMSKDPLLLDRNIKQYLSEIEHEKTQKQLPTAIIDHKGMAAHSQSDQLSDFSQDHAQIRKQSKSSDVELEAEYFAKNRKACAEPVEPNSPEESLLIYYFNNNQDLEQQSRLAAPPKPINFVRKIRSKSEDVTYVPDDNLGLDDEFFQKYQ